MMFEVVIYVVVIYVLIWLNEERIKNKK